MNWCLTQNARTVREHRYLKKDARARILEAPVQLIQRVARVVAVADRYFDTGTDVAAAAAGFEALLGDGRFLPKSPTLMSAVHRGGDYPLINPRQGKRCNAYRPGQCSICWSMPPGNPESRGSFSWTP